MIYDYDFEFEENGKTIIPISLGIVSDKGDELYLINKEYAETYFSIDPYYWKDEPSIITNWLSKNVMNQITEEDVFSYGLNYEDWGPVVQDFISDFGRIKRREDNELWGYYGAYDHVALAQIWGPMIMLPQPIPMFTHEIMQLKKGRVAPPRPVELPEHHALNDAKYQQMVRRAWQ